MYPSNERHEKSPFGHILIHLCETFSYLKHSKDLVSLWLKKMLLLSQMRKLRSREVGLSSSYYLWELEALPVSSDGESDASLSIFFHCCDIVSIHIFTDQHVF